MTSQAIWSFRWDYTLGDVISMDSATLQAPSGGKLGGSTDKKGPTTILCKTEKGSTKKSYVPSVCGYSCFIYS